MDYKRIYDSLCVRGQSRNWSKKEQYYEKHHIVPLCMGGSNIASNLTKLTAREHFLCHLLLTKIYPAENKLKFAFAGMARCNKNQQRTLTARHYELARIAFAEASRGRITSEETKKKISESKRGKKRNSLSDETKLKISAALTGRTMSAEFIEKCRNKKISEEQKEKISKSLTGRKRPPFSEEHRRKLSEAARSRNKNKSPS